MEESANSVFSLGNISKFTISQQLQFLSFCNTIDLVCRCFPIFILNKSFSKSMRSFDVQIKKMAFDSCYSKDFKIETANKNREIN